MRARLDLAHAAVDVEFDARDVRSVGRSEESDGGRDFLGSAERFKGTLERILLANSSICSLESPVRSKMGVSIGPGATELMRMPRSTSSAARVREKERSAAFVAE